MNSLASWSPLSSLRSARWLLRLPSTVIASILVSRLLSPLYFYVRSHLRDNMAIQSDIIEVLFIDDDIELLDAVKRLIKVGLQAFVWVG